MKKLLFLVSCFLVICGFNVLADDTVSYRQPAVSQESDPIVGAINGIPKADGAGNISQAQAGTDYLAPNGSAANLTDFPTLNQNTTGTAAGLSGTPALPNGTTATTQSAGDNSTKVATTAYADAKVADSINDGTTDVAPSENAVYDALAGKVASDGAVNPTNLLSNWNFEYWPNGASSDAANWAPSGGTIAREATTVKISTYSAKLTSTTDYLYQNVTAVKGINYWKGRTCTLSCWVNASAASRARIAIYDGVNWNYSSYHTGGSSFELLSVTATVDSSATELTAVLKIENGTSTSVYFDGAMFVEGSSLFASAMRAAEKPMYRGDPSSMDKTQADLTMDAAWHDLDLSAIVGAGEKMVVLFVSAQDNTVGAYLQFRKNGQSNANNIGGLSIIVANQYHYATIIIFCDSSGVIEYKVSETFSNINIGVVGWIQ